MMTMTAKLLYFGPPLQVLHEEYAKHSRIDDRAAVRVSCQASIAAPPAEVWEILGNPENWSQADAAIHDVRLDSGVQADATFSWRNGSASMKSRFAVVRPVIVLTWTGTSMGYKAIHQHLLRETGDSHTLLRANESMAGPLLPLIYPAAKLRAALKVWIDGIKRVAEERHNRAAPKAPDGRPDPDFPNPTGEARWTSERLNRETLIVPGAGCRALPPGRLPRGRQPASPPPPGR